MSASDSPQPVAATSDSIPASVDPQSIEGLFLAALQKSDPAERAAYLDEVCGGDEDRRRRVAALLRAYEDAGSFLETPAGGKRLDGTIDELRLDFLAPTDKPGCLGVLGPYEVLNVIGRGGMGIVLRALDPKLNRIVAVKVLAPELAANPNARKRFLREAQAAAAISHPHVVTIHAVEDGASSGLSTLGSGLPYLVMECVVGQSLQEKLDKVGSLNVTEILRITHQIASGLTAAHKQGLIHRDIKPANILLENGVERVKITDFGLARLVDDVAITRTGEVSGTPQYMSPEQAKGERVDHRSDLFSLGCVMYAMCTGHSPFRGDSLAHVIKRVTQDTPRPLEELNPDLPRWLVEIVNRLLEKSPERRFQTSGELGDLLGLHLARQQHALPGGVSHSGINAQHLPTVQPIREPARWTHPAEAPTAGGPRLIRVPWFWRLFGGLLLAAGGAVVAGHLLLALMAHLNPTTAARMGDFQSHLLQALFFLYPAVIGGLLTSRWLSSHAMLGLLFLAVGPLGLAIWLIRREAWEAMSVDAEAARALDRSQRSSHPEFDAALRWTVIVAVIAAVVFIGMRMLLPVPDVMDFVGKLGAGAAFVGLTLLIVGPLVAPRWGINGRHMLLKAGPSLWTLACVSMLTIIGYDAIVVQNTRNPNTSLLIVVTAFWLIPVAGMLYLLRKRELSANITPQPAIDQSTAQRPASLFSKGFFLCIAGVLASIIVMLLINSDGRLPFGIGFNDGVVMLFVTLLILGLPALVLWWLFRRQPGDLRTFSQRLEAAREKPGQLLAKLAIAGLLLFVALPALYISLALLIPAWQSASMRSDTIPLTIQFDPTYPIQSITDTNHRFEFVSDKRPFPLRLTPGVHTLVVRYSDQGLGYEFTKSLTVTGQPSGPPVLWDFSTDIERHRSSRLVPQTQELSTAGSNSVGSGMSSPAAGPMVMKTGRPQAILSPAAATPSSAPTSVAWVAGTGYHTSIHAGMHVQMQSEGLVLALRKKSLFDGTIDQQETLISEFGDSYPNLDRGEYEWLLRDLQYGWVADRRGSVTILDPDEGALIVQRNLAEAITPIDTRNDPAAAAKVLPLRFRWNGSEYRLDEIQAEAVQLLATAALSGNPNLPSAELVARLNEIAASYGLNAEGVPYGEYAGGPISHSGFGRFSGDSPQVGFPIASLENLFKAQDHVHAAWEKLIVDGEQPETFRLAPAELGRLIIDQPADARSVLIRTKSAAIEFLTAGRRELTLSSGEYAYEFIPLRPDVAWTRPSSVGYLPFSNQRKTKLAAGGEVQLDLTPQLADALEPQSYVEAQNAMSAIYIFRWYGFGNLADADAPEPDQDGLNGYSLNHPQARCIVRLLQGLIDNMPDIAESELLEIATKAGWKPPETEPRVTTPSAAENQDAQPFLLEAAPSEASPSPPPPMESLFPGLQAGQWKDLLTTGKAEGTWRLSVPQSPAP